MKIQTHTLLLASSLLLAPAFALAGVTDMANIARAAQVISQAQKIVEVMPADTQLDLPPPIKGNNGEFMNPYRQDGSLTEWAEKALEASAGAAAGGAVGNQAANMLASKIPFGGLFGSKIKETGKQQGAVMAAGGWDFIRDSSDQSFGSLDHLAAYMHFTYGTRGDYSKAVAAAMSIYPELQDRYREAIRKAYQGQTAVASQHRSSFFEE